MCVQPNTYGEGSPACKVQEKDDNDGGGGDGLALAIDNRNGDAEDGRDSKQDLLDEAMPWRIDVFGHGSRSR
ncbi:unnamed protein product [Mortierella alpina]